MVHALFVTERDGVDELEKDISHPVVSPVEGFPDNPVKEIAAFTEIQHDIVKVVLEDDLMECNNVGMFRDAAMVDEFTDLEPVLASAVVQGAKAFDSIEGGFAIRRCCAQGSIDLSKVAGTEAVEETKTTVVEDGAGKVFERVQRDRHVEKRVGCAKRDCQSRTKMKVGSQVVK